LVPIARRKSTAERANSSFIACDMILALQGSLANQAGLRPII
jgi:hypothetical protein